MPLRVTYNTINCRVISIQSDLIVHSSGGSLSRNYEHTEHLPPIATRRGLLDQDSLTALVHHSVFHLVVVVSYTM